MATSASTNFTLLHKLLSTVAGGAVEVTSNWKSGTLNTEAGLPLGGLGSRLGWQILWVGKFCGK